MKPSTDSQEGVGHCQGNCQGCCLGHICCHNWRWQEKHWQQWKSTGDGGRSVRHCLEPSTDSKEGVGRIYRSQHGLEKSTDSQETFLPSPALFPSLPVLFLPSQILATCMSWTMSLTMSYTFLTVCTWFQSMSTPLESFYTFLTVYTWFQTMSTH